MIVAQRQKTKPPEFYTSFGSHFRALGTIHRVHAERILGRSYHWWLECGYDTPRRGLPHGELQESVKGFRSKLCKGCFPPGSTDPRGRNQLLSTEIDPVTLSDSL